MSEGMNAPVSRPNFKEAAFLDGIPLATQADLQVVIRSFNDSLQAKILELLFNGATLPSGNTVGNATTTINIANHLTAIKKRFWIPPYQLLATSTFDMLSASEWLFPDGTDAKTATPYLASILICKKRFRGKIGYCANGAYAGVSAYVEIAPKLVMNASKNGLSNSSIEVKIYAGQKAVDDTYPGPALFTGVGAGLRAWDHVISVGNSTMAGTFVSGNTYVTKEEQWLAGMDITPDIAPTKTFNFTDMGQMVDCVGLFDPSVPWFKIDGDPDTFIGNMLSAFAIEPLEFEWFALAAK